MKKWCGLFTAINQDEAESLLHALANKFDGDPAATDSTRVLRLPGFANRKLPEEFIVKARQETAAVYALRDFTIPEDAPEAPRQNQQAHATAARRENTSVRGPRRSGVRRDPPWHGATAATPVAGTTTTEAMCSAANSRNECHGSRLHHARPAAIAPDWRGRRR